MPPRARGPAGGAPAPVGTYAGQQAADAGARKRVERQQPRGGAAGAYRLGYQRGREGKPDDTAQWSDHPHAQPYGQGYAAGSADRPAASTPAPSPTSTPPPAPADKRTAPGAGIGGTLTSWMPKEASGFALGLIVYAIALNWVRGGPKQAKAWLAAKFLNQVAGTGPADGFTNYGNPGAVAGQVTTNPAPPNVGSNTGTGALPPNPPLGGPGGPGLAIPGIPNDGVPV